MNGVYLIAQFGTHTKKPLRPYHLCLILYLIFRSNIRTILQRVHFIKQNMRRTKKLHNIRAFCAVWRHSQHTRFYRKQSMLKKQSTLTFVVYSKSQFHQEENEMKLRATQSLNRMKRNSTYRLFKDILFVITKMCTKPSNVRNILENTKNLQHFRHFGKCTQQKHSILKKTVLRKYLLPIQSLKRLEFQQIIIRTMWIRLHLVSVAI